MRNEEAKLHAVGEAQLKKDRCWKTDRRVELVALDPRFDLQPARGNRVRVCCHRWAFRLHGVRIGSNIVRGILCTCSPDLHKQHSPKNTYDLNRSQRTTKHI